MGPRHAVGQLQKTHEPPVPHILLFPPSIKMLGFYRKPAPSQPHLASAPDDLLKEHNNGIGGLSQSPPSPTSQRAPIIPTLSPSSTSSVIFAMGLWQGTLWITIPLIFCQPVFLPPDVVRPVFWWVVLPQPHAHPRNWISPHMVVTYRWHPQSGLSTSSFSALARLFSLLLTLRLYPCRAHCLLLLFLLLLLLRDPLNAR